MLPRPGRRAPRIRSRAANTYRTTIYPVASDPTDEPVNEPTDDEYRRLLELRTGLRRFLHWSEEQAGAVGVSPAHHQLMLAIRGHTGPDDPTVGDVATALLLRHHSAVGLVDRAVDAGLVT